jgi:ubiquinone/menaquinone biosynthesis C-methylase UbiE
VRALTKDWDRHVVEAEEVARGPGFRALRDAIIERARPRAEDRVVDIGAGTGLLTLSLARRTQRVWALDISPAMIEYLRAKAASAELENVEAVVGSAVSLPLVDESADLVVSNYCFHHLSDGDKVRALREARRVLVPGGRLVLGDMMFRPALKDARGRRVISSKVRAMARKGPAGVLRLAKNAARFAAARWEKPAAPAWWEQALKEAGFADASVEALPHEGGIAVGRKP